MIWLRNKWKFIKKRLRVLPTLDTRELNWSKMKRNSKRSIKSTTKSAWWNRSNWNRDSNQLFKEWVSRSRLNANKNLIIRINSLKNSNHNWMPMALGFRRSLWTVQNPSKNVSIDYLFFPWFSTIHFNFFQQFVINNFLTIYLVNQRGPPFQDHLNPDGSYQDSHHPDPLNNVPSGGQDQFDSKMMGNK